MATKSFLRPEQVEWAKKNFRLPPLDLGKRIDDQPCFGSDFSLWLGDQLLAKLSQHSLWPKTEPFRLGSWARDELCPKSDIDMIFAGPEDVVQKFVGEMQSEGLRLRARVPQDLRDWTVGVEPFDVLALIGAKAFFSSGDALLQVQKERIRACGSHHWPERIRKAIESERSLRQSRHDSVANYLEPNIKYGPGGLRDLEQALALRDLFAKRFSADDLAWPVLWHHKNFWLALRQRLHLNGGNDVLTGPDQLEFANDWGFDDLQSFMRVFQAGVSEVDFYARWALERAKKAAPARRVKWSNQSEALRSLEKNPSCDQQVAVREVRHSLKGPHHLVDYFRINQLEKWFQALFDSRLIDEILPDVKRLRGLVQHDHYHRFTADAHLLQAILTVLRVKKKPSLIGKLSRWVRVLKPADWQVLLWTALFHDLAKGQGHDHAERGAEIAKKELRGVGVAVAVAEEVSWMVKNHLLLSTVAFRLNTQDPATWQRLQQSGAEADRLRRLAIFTAIDILATNPDAWNDWKERMLVDLLKNAESETATHYFHLFAEVSAATAQTLSAQLDPLVVTSIPTRRLVEDLKRLIRQKSSLKPLVWRSRSKETWVRFHSREDRPGLFLNYARQLYSLGCSVQQSSVRTFAQLGAYDWFQVKTQKSPRQIEKQLQLVTNLDHIATPAIKLQNVELISQTDQELVLSFRGKDQKGLLLATAQALFESHCRIRWAKVVTWGSQIDDVFAVERRDLQPEILVQGLRERFQVGAQSTKSLVT